MKFTSVVSLHGKTATGIEVPDSVVAELGGGKRPAVRVTINDHSFRSSLTVIGGRFLVPIGAEVREQAGLAAGDTVEVGIDLDVEEREVVIPTDLRAALAEAKMEGQFESTSYFNRRRIVTAVTSAKSAGMRKRRIERAVADLFEATL